MAIEQLFLQLGAIGAVLFVLWKLGGKWIDRLGESERDRTKEIAEGFKQITTSLNLHHSADIASHERIHEAHGDLRVAVARVEGKIDAALDWQERTPVDGPRRPTPSAGIYSLRPSNKDDRRK